MATAKKSVKKAAVKKSVSNNALKKYVKAKPKKCATTSRSSRKPDACRKTAKAAQARKTVAKTRNPHGHLIAPSVSVMREEAWSSFWLNVKPVYSATSYEMEISLTNAFVNSSIRIVKFANQRTWFKELEDGFLYFYRVRALKLDKRGASRHGPWSRIGKKQLTLYGITSPASEIVAEGNAKTIDLMWTAAESHSKNPITYRVVMASDRAMENKVQTVATTNCKATFTKAKPNTLYYFRVNASNNGNRERGDATRWATRTQGSLVSANSSRTMSVTNFSPRGLSAHWPDFGPASGYFLEVAEDEQFERVVGLYNGYPGERQIGVNNLDPDTTYFVRAIDKSGREGLTHSITTSAEAESLRIGTYNVRYVDLDGPQSAHSWAKRRTHVAEVLTNFDVIGIQEASSWKNSRTFRGRNQRDDLLHATKALTKNDFAVAAMPDAKNPGVHVFYRPSVVKETGEFRHLRWKVGEQNRGQAAVVRLNTIATGTEFLYASVHLSPFVTHEERATHALELAAVIATMNTKNLPVIVVGDLNSHSARVDDTPKVVLTDSKRSGLTLFDAEDWEPMRERTLKHSANTDWKPRVIETSGHKIDYVLVDERIAVTEWDYVSVWTPTGLIRKPHASDHLAIRVLIVFGA